MAFSLLATKFFIPPTRPDAVARSRLLEKLRAGAARPGCFTLLSGPAGSGKTTLLSAFAARPFTDRRQPPVAWLSLDEGDNDPLRFWTYVITACRSVLADVGETALALLREAQPLPPDTIPTLLINDLTARDTALALILDDYHTIHKSAIQSGVGFYSSTFRAACT